MLPNVTGKTVLMIILTINENICKALNDFVPFGFHPKTSDFEFRKLKVKVSHSLIVVEVAVVRPPLYLGHSK